MIKIFLAVQKILNRRRWKGQECCWSKEASLLRDFAQLWVSCLLFRNHTSSVHKNDGKQEQQRHRQIK